MSLSHRYKNLGGQSGSQIAELEHDSESDIEELKLQAFDTGYQAGWDDAVKAQDAEETRISAELSQNLQDISFTYQEAVAKISAAFEPVLTEMIEKVLPAVSRDTLGVHIIDQVRSIVRDAIESPLEIVVSPGNLEKVSGISKEFLAEPFQVVEDNTLCDEQVFVRVGISERQIDLKATIDEVAKATDAFFHELKEQQKDG